MTDDDDDCSAVLMRAACGLSRAYPPARCGCAPLLQTDQAAHRTMPGPLRLGRAAHGPTLTARHYSQHTRRVVRRHAGSRLPAPLSLSRCLAHTSSATVPS